MFLALNNSGGVSCAFSANVADNLVRDLGRWKSTDVIQTYRRDLLHNQNVAADQMTAAIANAL